MIFNIIVVNGLPKNSKLEIIGSVCFNPKKLNNSAKKIMDAISITLEKWFLYVFKDTFCLVNINSKKDVVKTTISWLESITKGGTEITKFFQWIIEAMEKLIVISTNNKCCVNPILIGLDLVDTI